MEHSLFDTYSLCCYINAPLCAFPLFIFSCFFSPFLKKKKKGSRDALGTTVSAAFISYESLAIIPPSSVKKSQPASAGTQMNDCCLLRWIISQEMCLHRRLCLALLLSICSSLCFSAGKQNAVTREGRRRPTRVQSLMRGLMMTSMRDLI